MLITETVSKIGAWNPFSTLTNLIDFFKNIDQWIMGLLNGIMSIFMMIPYMLFVGFSYIVIFCQAVFNKLAGLDPNVSVLGKKTDNIVLSFLLSSEVLRVFISMVVFSVLLLMIFSVIAIIKSEFTLESKNSAKGPIFGRALKALAMFVATPVATIFGLYLVSGVTNSLNKMLGADQIGLHSQLFYLGAQSANRVRLNSSFAEYIRDGNNKPIEIDKTTEEEIAAEIDTFFKNETTATFKVGSFASGSGLMVPNTHAMLTGMPRPDEVNTNKFTFSLTNVRLVMYYYDLMQFNWVLGFGSVLYLSYILLSTCIALIKRIFDIIILFLISPAMISIYPLDNGDAAKKINKQMIAKVVSVLVTVFAFNMYFILLPAFMRIDLFPASAAVSASAVTNVVSSVSMASLSSSVGAGALGVAVLPSVRVVLNAIWGVLCICVGASIIKQASALVTSALGTEDLIKSGTDSSKKIVQTAAKVGVGIATGGASIAAKLGFGKAGKSMMEKAGREGQDAYEEEYAKSGDIDKATAAKESAAQKSIKDSKKGFNKKFFEAMPGVVGGTAKTVSDVRKGIKELNPDSDYDAEFKAQKIKAQIANDKAEKIASFSSNRTTTNAEKARSAEFAKVKGRDIIGDVDNVKTAQDAYDQQKSTVDSLNLGADRAKARQALVDENQKHQTEIDKIKSEINKSKGVKSKNPRIKNKREKIEDSLKNQLKIEEDEFNKNSKIIQEIDVELKLKTNLDNVQTKYNDIFKDVTRSLSAGNSTSAVSGTSSGAKEIIDIIDAKSKEANMIKAKIDVLNTELSALSIQERTAEVESKINKIGSEIERLKKASPLKK